jgi:hypothetical protein
MNVALERGDETHDRTCLEWQALTRKHAEFVCGQFMGKAWCVVLVAGLVRLVRGGNAQAGSAIPMRPMHGMVGIVSGFFAKPHQVESPPEHESNERKSG